MTDKKNGYRMKIGETTIFIIAIIFFMFLLLFIFHSCFASKNNTTEKITQVYNSRGDFKLDPKVIIYHDDKRNITCYVFIGMRERSAFCISDYEIKIKKEIFKLYKSCVELGSGHNNEKMVKACQDIIKK